MKHWLNFIFSIVFLATSGTALAQQDSVVVQESNNFSVNLYIDYGKLFTLPSDFEQKLEAGVGISIKKINIAVEAGYANLTPEDAINNGTYQSTGNYARIGADYVHTFRSQFRVYGGLRYALSQYEDQGTAEIKSELWDTQTITFERKDETAQWAEIVLGTDAKFLKQNWLWIGWRMRIKILTQKNSYEPIDILAIPGYGRTLNKSIPSFNFYLMFKI